MAETVGKVYSTALFELCTEQDKLEKVFSDYREFQELMKDKECADYLRFLASPLISGRDKADSLKAVFGDKIDPLLRGAYDNLEVLLSHPDDSPEEIEGKVSFVFDRGYIDAQSLAYLRGRSITKTFIIIDEAQNCSVMQILSIITRAGEGTKIVLLGDINQIDNPRLDSRNNGLIYAMEKMKGSSLCEIVSFDESECTRSPLAKEASAKLKR